MNFMEEFQAPPTRFSPAAFWFWYGELTPQRMREQIRMMTEQGVYNGFMHARAYLKTPYLGKEWWEAVEACVDEGEKTGFYPWLYDEYAWPSGTAGSTFDYGFQAPSRTLAKGECNMSKSLKVHKYGSFAQLYRASEEKRKYVSLYRAFYKDGECWQPIREEQLDPEDDGRTEIMAFFLYIHPKFVDYLNKEPTKEFLQYTHEEYKARFAKYFGNRIPGVFFDEIFMIFNMPWTFGFPEEFEKCCGYDLLPVLYALGERGGEKERRIRIDYFRVVAKLYEECFFKQYSEWCKENCLEYTGHIEEWLCKHPGRQGHFFDNMRHLSIPGSVCHDYRYRFPRKITYREPKFSVSVARAYGKERAMSEALGGAGWGCSLQQFKRGINTICAMGSSMITLHGFYSECDSQGTQADWPNSFFFQNPYWRYFRHFASYIQRLCYMNSLGEPVVDVGLYYPIEEMQAETVAGGPTEEGMLLDSAFNGAMNTLIEHQIDVDMIDGHSIERADTAGGRLCVGSQRFCVILCPEAMRPSDKVKEKLVEFERNGGIVVYYEHGAGCRKDAVSYKELPRLLKRYMQPDVEVIRGAMDNLYVSHRKVQNRDVYFIANSVPRCRSVMLLLRERGGVSRLEPEDGTIKEIACEITGKGTLVDLELNEDGSCFLVVDSQSAPANQKLLVIREELSVPGIWEFLPVPSELTGKEQLEVNRTELKIPLAAFSSDIHPDGRQIRICNKPGEPGNCGRHLSRWKASWITRRPDWIDDAQKKILVFRKRLFLDEKPSAAGLCIAAVNEWTLWINGTFVADGKNGMDPVTVDITDYLRRGENLFAVKVCNQTPMGHFNLLSVEELPKGEMISLLVQAELTVNGKVKTLCTDSTWEVNDRVPDGWEQPGFLTEPVKMEASSYISFGDDVSGDIWMYAWERGCPPLLPWGDIPLFDGKISYPRKVCYSLTLPAGTALIREPELTGSMVQISVDGMNLPFEKGKCILRPDGQTHQLQIGMTVMGPAEGLHKPVTVEVIPFGTALSDWRLHGLKWYSGFARYTNRLKLDKKEGIYELALGKVGFQAEVFINGTFAGERIWEPYTLDVTNLLKDGDNEITVIASNSAAVERQYMLVDEGQALGWNRYWNYDNIQREGENLVSGLLGTVQLIRKEIEEK